MPAAAIFLIFIISIIIIEMLTFFTSRKPPLFLRLFSSSSLNSKLMYEREIRSTLSKLERVISFIPEQSQQRKTVEDMQRIAE